MATFLRQGLRHEPTLAEVSLAIQRAEAEAERVEATEVIETTSLAETRAAYRSGKCVLVDLTEVEGRNHRGVFDDEEPRRPRRRRKHRKSNVPRMMRQAGPTDLKKAFG